MRTKAFPVTQAEYKHLRKSPNLDEKQLKFERTQVHKRRSLGKTYVVVSDFAIRSLNRRVFRARLFELVARLCGRHSRRYKKYGLA